LLKSSVSRTNLAMAARRLQVLNRSHQLPPAVADTNTAFFPMQQLS